MTWRVVFVCVELNILSGKFPLTNCPSQEGVRDLIVYPQPPGGSGLIQFVVHSVSHVHTVLLLFLSFLSYPVSPFPSPSLPRQPSAGGPPLPHGAGSGQGLFLLKVFFLLPLALVLRSCFVKCWETTRLDIKDEKDNNKSSTWIVSFSLVIYFCLAVFLSHGLCLICLIIKVVLWR